MKPMPLLKPAIALLAGIGLTLQAHAGIPVIDGANLVNNQLNYAESMAQTLQQIEDYAVQGQQLQTQAEQYANMLKNSVVPQYIWDEAQGTINQLIKTTDTLAYYKQQIGSLDSYLDKFQDLDYYKSSPCFTSAGCSDEQRAELDKIQELASESQKKANDAMLLGLEKQQQNLASDSSRLQELQQTAQSADGQMKALGVANQLASQQANQLLQLRSLLMAQQNAVATKMQADADKEAMQEAASQKFWDMGGPTDRSKSEGFKP